MCLFRKKKKIEADPPPICRTLHNYHCGDKVRVIDNIYGHTLQIGNVYTIFNVLNNDSELCLVVIDEEGEMQTLAYDEVRYLHQCGCCELPVEVTITFDGKKTVASIWANGEVTTATAECGKWDIPDWYKGATIALGRLL